MNEIFRYENPAMRFLSNMFNIFWVNLLFIFTCIPIITIGPSLCALYKVCLKIVSGDEILVYKVYFEEFKSSFKKGTILWIMIVGLLAFFSMELYYIYFRPDVISEKLSFLQYPVWVMIFLVVQVFLYGFALLATFENTLIKTIKNAILLSIKNFMITIMLIAIWLFTPLLANTLPDFAYGLLGFEVFFNLALRVLFCSLFLHKAFGLTKIKTNRDGTVSELAYEDVVEVLPEAEEKHETESDKVALPEKEKAEVNDKDIVEDNADASNAPESVPDDYEPDEDDLLLMEVTEEEMRELEKEEDPEQDSDD